MQAEKVSAISVDEYRYEAHAKVDHGLLMM